MNAIKHTYNSLLADIADKTGYSEIRGSCFNFDWCLKEAPKLEKRILVCLEQYPDSLEQLFASKEFREVHETTPEWLHRLVIGSLVDPIQLRYLRQLLLFCYKAYVQHDKQTTKSTFANFAKVNREVGASGNELSRVHPGCLDFARKLCQSVLYKVRDQDISPGHGPGAVTTSKDVWQRWYSQIECLYPYSDWYTLYFNREHIEQGGELTDEHIEAKLIAVPKDSRGPRLICVHPAEAMWIQQGLRRELERAISLNRYQRGVWPKGNIHFDDQTVNGRLALVNSRTRKYATLDLKEASDRISDVLVQYLFGGYYKAFGCCRAQKYIIADEHGKPVFTDDLYSYAPMGNATVFPVQSLVFWAICCASMHRQGYRNRSAAFVFGDDIIVPSKYAPGIVRDLEAFGLVVNKEKSFWRGHFRESCGVEAFKGFDVTPVRWKTTLDAEYLSGLLSLSELAMRLRIAGYEGAASTAYGIVRHRLRSVYGLELFYTNNPDHGQLAEYVMSYSLAFSCAYWHRDLQKYVTPTIQPKLRDYGASKRDWNHVLESVLSIERTGRGSVPDRSVLRRIRLMRGWTSFIFPEAGGEIPRASE